MVDRDVLPTAKRRVRLTSPLKNLVDTSDENVQPEGNKDACFAEDIDVVVVRD